MLAIWMSRSFTIEYMVPHRGKGRRGRSKEVEGMYNEKGGVWKVDDDEGGAFGLFLFCFFTFITGLWFRSVLCVLFSSGFLFFFFFLFHIIMLPWLVEDEKSVDFELLGNGRL
jgi:hypothetical protein